MRGGNPLPFPRLDAEFAGLCGTHDDTLGLSNAPPHERKPDADTGESCQNANNSANGNLILNSSNNALEIGHADNRTSGRRLRSNPLP